MNAPSSPTGLADGADLRADADTWHPLPQRSRLLFVLDALPLVIPIAVPLVPLAVLVDMPLVVVVPAWLAAALVLAIAFGIRSHRYAFWRLDAHGLAIRRGRAWLREVRVPVNRVQHLDLKQGPLQRARGLATLVIHTAGTRHAAINLPHLDEHDARRLRDVLSEQIDHDDA